MLHRVVVVPSAELRLLSSSALLTSKPKTFLFRSRLPQTNVQSPFADPMRTRVEIQNDVFITVKSAEKDVVSNLSDPSIGSFGKLTAFIKKLSSSANHKLQ